MVLRGLGRGSPVGPDPCLPSSRAFGSGSQAARPVLPARTPALTLSSSANARAQELRAAVAGLTFTPRADSNVLNTADIASVTVTLDDLGAWGGGGAKQSPPLTVDVLVEAVNDGPVLEAPGSLRGKEDVPLAVSPVRLSDVDLGEPGGERRRDPIDPTRVLSRRVSCPTRPAGSRRTTGYEGGWSLSRNASRSSD